MAAVVVVVVVFCENKNKDLERHLKTTWML